MPNNGEDGYLLTSFLTLGALPANLNDWADVAALLRSQVLLWKIGLQFLLVFLVVSWVYFKIQGTYIAQLLKGLAVLLLGYIAAWLFKLTILSGILQALLQISVIGFIILFQPELRRMLVYLGQPDLLSKTGLLANSKEKTAKLIVHELVESVRILSKNKIGALMVLEAANSPSGSYLEAGTRLDAHLSTELLLTLFHPKTPLHDGAVIISVDGHILSAGVLLPLSENPNLTWKYGTRHRAAIGISEVSDCRCLVVSEESGNVSLTLGGHIQRIADSNELTQVLEGLYGVHHHAPLVGAGADAKRSPIGEFFSMELFSKLFPKKGHKRQSETTPSDDHPKIAS